jgi:hypothetical protein
VIEMWKANHRAANRHGLCRQGLCRQGPYRGFAAGVIGLGLLAATLCAGAGPAQAIAMNEVVLQALDKITARVSRITVPVGGTVTFGPLQITAKACDKHPPEEPPESAAFLQIVEVKQGEAPVGRFSGWMFASSPALSAMEHPVYDIWVLDCINAESAPGGSSP